MIRSRRSGARASSKRQSASPADSKRLSWPRGTTFAPAVVKAPEEGSVLRQNPADQMIYYYTERPWPPRGQLPQLPPPAACADGLGREPRESEPGVYRTHGAACRARLL